MSFRHAPAESRADIIENAERIATYIGGMDQFSFEQNGLVRDGVERCLERICEAVYRLRERAKELLPGQPVRDIRGMGNRLRHAYERIALTVVWAVVQRDVPELAAAARRALAALEPGHGENGSGLP